MNQSSNTKGFIEDLEFLKEYDNDKDLFGYDKHAQKLYGYLAALPSETAIITLKGPYGIGKSFLINLMKKRSIKKDTKRNYWFCFESWRYTDRKDLWRAFVAEIDEDVAQDSYQWPCIRKARNLLQELRFGINFVFAVLLLGISVLSLFLSLIPGINLMQAYFVVIALFALMISTLGVYLRNPFYRQEGYEKQFKGIIKKLKKHGYQKAYIVLEDVDRSQDQGLLFLETLSLFLRKLRSEDQDFLPIKVIVPMSDQSFDSARQKASLLKAVDYTYSFNINYLDIKGFVAKVFHKEFANAKMKICVESIFKLFFVHGDTPNQFNLRTWKIILRGAQDRYIYLKTKKIIDDVQPIICILIEAMKYIEVKSSQKTINLFDQVLLNGGIQEPEFAQMGIFKILFINDNKLKADEALALDTSFIRHCSLTVSDELDLRKKGSSGFCIKNPGSAVRRIYEIVLSRSYFDEGSKQEQYINNPYP